MLAFCLSIFPFLAFFSVPLAFAEEDNSSNPSNSSFVPPMNDAKKNSEEKEKEFYECLGKKEGDKCEVIYDTEKGKCAWWNKEKEQYERPLLKYEPMDKFKCLPDLHNRIFTHVCGDQLYEQLKYCAKVKFFNNLAPENGGLDERRENILLLLLDGCILCIGDRDVSDDSLITVTMKLSFTHLEGSFFTGCFEQIVHKNLFSISFPYNASITKETIAKGTHSKSVDGEISVGSMIGQIAFAFPTLLIERNCQGLFTKDEPNGGFSDVTLTVEHNCNSVKKNKPIVESLTDWLQIDEFKHNVAELRRLHIDLRGEKIRQFSALSGKYVKNDSPMEFDNLELPEDEGF